MPYVKQAEREMIAGGAIPLVPFGSGGLAYKLYKTALESIDDDSYQSYAAVVGVLETVKLEFVRRIVAPYEDKKLQENGDV